jgi:hypothetical protein
MRWRLGYLGALTPVLASRAPRSWHLARPGYLAWPSWSPRPASRRHWHPAHSPPVSPWPPSSSPAPARYRSRAQFPRSPRHTPQHHPQSVHSVISVITVTIALAALALLAPFKAGIGLLEEGQTYHLAAFQHEAASRPVLRLVRRPIPAPDSATTLQTVTCVNNTLAVLAVLSAFRPGLAKRASRPLAALPYWHPYIIPRPFWSPARCSGSFDSRRPITGRRLRRVARGRGGSRARRRRPATA